MVVFFFKQKTAYEMRISDWSSDVCSSDLLKSGVLPLLDEYECPSCGGSRVNPLARHVTINNLNIHQVCQQPIEQTFQFIDKLVLKQEEFKLLDEVKTQQIGRAS